MSLLVATGNKGKLHEFRSLLTGLRIRTPDDVRLGNLYVEETGDTFYDNALLKAKAYATASGLLSVADDSGLEVDALGGRPGVQSARYGGRELDDSGRYRHLLAELIDVPPEARTARFRCCLVVFSPDGRLVTAEGTCEGRILMRPSGEGGFGYDPVFLVPAYGRSMAALSRSEKSAISHRGRALRSLLPVLTETFPALLSN
ncbi:MAG: RdgB/HAM1 family non-canonical purine NTP pyrophosphatase [bacterium]|nr:RdgB/HAM1 family non-canonical purine NTP pyrophosphatase [bacterium]